MEKRQEERISVESLPECLRTVIVSTGFFQEHTAVTVDASNNGMGFLIEGISETSIHTGEDIIIKVLPYNYKLKSRVLYVKQIADNKVRFGINFIKEKPLDKYQELLTLDIYRI